MRKTLEEAKFVYANRTCDWPKSLAVLRLTLPPPPVPIRTNEMPEPSDTHMPVYEFRREMVRRIEDGEHQACMAVTWEGQVIEQLGPWISYKPEWG